MADIKSGDVVVLKSDGRVQLTVEHVSGDTLFAWWLNVQGELQRLELPLSILIKKGS